MSVVVVVTDGVIVFVGVIVTDIVLVAVDVRV